MQSVINMKKLSYTKRISKDFNFNFNCWGATLYILDQRKSLLWINNVTMKQFLIDNTVITNEKKKGNILCLYSGKVTLKHTAVYLDNVTLWHKRGVQQGEQTTEEEIYKLYKHKRIEIRELAK